MGYEMENDFRDVKPIVLNDGNGHEYTLEFNRSSVMFAENHGFNLSNVSDKVMTGMSELFFYAFRMHHPNMTKIQTDKILFDELGGLSNDMATRLGMLFALPYNSLTFENNEPKNSKWSITM